ncbi:MAG: hypothetical protein IPJ88_02150 [Myxococcales bacterium]|nr:MAG: hypothetical protein IPJ88_02150 [Myxococcales bacterium]
MRYEPRAFDTSTRPSRPVCVVDRGASGDLEQCELSDSKLRIVSGFEMLVMGVRYDKSSDSTSAVHNPSRAQLPFYFGVGLMSY